MKVTQTAQPDGSPIVFVVDDDVALLQALESLISTAGWRSQMFTSADEFRACPRALAPGCLVLNLPARDRSGVALQVLLADRMALPVIVTGYHDVPTIVRVMKAGAFEFLTKPFQTEPMLGALTAAIDVSRFLTKREAEFQELSRRYASLSLREREVMALVVQGRLNKLIAAALGISEITVKAHRGKMMRKMRAASVAHLVRMATELSEARLATDLAALRTPPNFTPGSLLRNMISGALDGSEALGPAALA